MNDWGKTWCFIVYLIFQVNRVSYAKRCLFSSSDIRSTVMIGRALLFYFLLGFQGIISKLSIFVMIYLSGETTHFKLVHFCNSGSLDSSLQASFWCTSVMHALSPPLWQTGNPLTWSQFLERDQNCNSLLGGHTKTSGHCTVSIHAVTEWHASPHFLLAGNIIAQIPKGYK